MPKYARKLTFLEFLQEELTDSLVEESNIPVSPEYNDIREWQKSRSQVFREVIDLVLLNSYPKLKKIAMEEKPND